MTSTTKIKRRMLAARRYADHYPQLRLGATGRKARRRYLEDRRTLRVRRFRRRQREVSVLMAAAFARQTSSLRKFAEAVTKAARAMAAFTTVNRFPEGVTA